MDSPIRRLTPENFSKCANIYDMDKNPAQIKRWYDAIVSGNRLTFVYVEEGDYVGEGSLVIDNGDPDYTIEGRRVYLSRMIVKKECRNRGIGRALLRFLTDYARVLGFSEMSVGVDIINIGARWLYEKNGFNEIIYVGEDADGKYVKLLKKL
jgi:GNAT superfamily N-acetyltransferase